MKRLLQRNKKGVSEVVGYVLLIAVAVSISFLVYSYLKLYVPKEIPKCQEEVSLIVYNYTCANQQLALTLQNKGFFSIDGAFIRYGSSESKIKTTNLNNISVSGKDYNCILFNDLQCASLGPLIIAGQGLKPGETLTRIFKNSALQTGEIEIEPVILESNKQVLCEEATIRQPINCN